MSPSDLLENVLRLRPEASAGLERLRLKTAAELLHYFPARYGAAAAEKTIASLIAGETAVIYGEIKSAKVAKAWRKKIPLGEVTVADLTGEIKAVWFHQPYLAKKVTPGQLARLEGKVTLKAGKPYLANPLIEPARDLAGSQSLFGEGTALGSLLPVYPETRALSSLWFHQHIKKLLSERLQEQIADPLPEPLLQKYHLPPLATALIWIHAPQKAEDALAARKRFAFQEVFLLQLARGQARAAYREAPAAQIKTDPKIIDDFLGRLPFALTAGQRRAVSEITTDWESGQPMARLLEGDVGSGKTAVAAATALAAVTAGYEVAYMAPTEILARQHFESFINYFKYRPNTQLGLITGAGCYKFPSKINPSGATLISRNQLLKWVAGGEIPILIGTQALIQKTVRFKNLAYVIIDEQHRFGVMQRAALAKKGSALQPHLLSMTATPIPRTLALTIYGDLDLSLLDELPPGRQTPVTKIIAEGERSATYEKIRAELSTGRQAFVICPRIDEPDPSKALALLAKSAKAEAKRLQEKVFPEFPVGLVHSKLKPKDKEGVMAEFAAGNLKILVATSVVEVGVNVPNATIILIEGAERFGLAQLHQLRGRVLRSSHQAYCYLFTDSKNAKSQERLKALQTAASGFKLAELDLALRGAGSLAGSNQWGLSDIGMEALQNLKMVEAARLEAKTLLAADPRLTKFPLLRERLTKKSEIHFE
jgi:ATP-dependent DNA helicase RecG